MMTLWTNPRLRAKFLIGILLVLEIALFIFLIGTFTYDVSAGVNQTVIVTTTLQVGTVAPEVINVSINWGNVTADLLPNSTVNVTAYAFIRDYNNESDLKVAYAEFFDTSSSSYGGANDNNFHYTNPNCTLNRSIGDVYEALAICNFSVWYYAYNSSWNATFTINDTENAMAIGSDTITINALLAVGLPDSIDYGVVNSTFVSDQKIANVTNFGNVRLNISLSGYAVSPGDNRSMNCTLGAVKNISIEHEKYNLTASNTGALTLPQTAGLYLNLSSATVVKKFDLAFRGNDGANDALNSTYWRMYVPVGVAGSCSGNIVFAATTGTGS